MTTEYTGTIWAKSNDRQALENIGIILGSHNGYEFTNCIVSEEAMEKLDKLWGRYYWKLEDKEWVTVGCSSGNCRGRRNGKRGFPVTIKASKLEDYNSGKYRPVCNECFSK